MTDKIGVAISTTGDEHRLGFLETCVAHWRAALPLGSVLLVTVDGSEVETQRAYDAYNPHDFGNVYRVGQPNDKLRLRDCRIGVAANKNTGLELLMEAGVEHLFLCDDDTWPLHRAALDKHIDMGIQHSMVCWGKSRLIGVKGAYAEWNWPRGVMLYTQRDVVERVGGMDERFGFGGHEHVEWSRRIYNAGFTPYTYVSPASYALKGESGAATRAGALWNCEDMRKPGEMPHEWDARKKENTSIRRKGSDWERIDKIMAEHENDTSFVPYKAHDNERSSATLCSSSSCDCAQEPEPETPRSDS